MNPAVGAALGVMLVLVLLEQWLLWWRSGRSVDWRQLSANLGSGHLLMWWGRCVELGGYALVARQLGWQGLAPALGWAIWPLAWVGWDACFYWMHRLHHQIPLLWRVHAVHHQGSEFSLALGIRNSWYSSLTSLPFMLPLALAGVPAEVFLLVSSLHYGVQFYNHTALVGPNWLDRWMVTPTNHRAHHGMAPYYRNCNFGSTLLLWDRCFGSYRRWRPALPADCGLAGWRPSYNPLWLNHGGWRPAAGAAARWPRMMLPDGYIGLGALLLCAGAALYLGGAGGGAGPALALLLVLGALALGAAADGNPLGVYALQALSGAVLILLCCWPGPAVAALALVWWLHHAFAGLLAQWYGPGR